MNISFTVFHAEFFAYSINDQSLTSFSRLYQELITQLKPANNTSIELIKI